MMITTNIKFLQPTSKNFEERFCLLKIGNLTQFDLTIIRNTPSMVFPLRQLIHLKKMLRTEYILSRQQVIQESYQVLFKY